MTRLFQAEMAEREFGRAAVRVDALLQWATKAGIVFPPTSPDVRQFEVAHLESLLCAIENAATADATQDELQVLALQIGHPHASTQRMIEEGDSNICRWLVGANTHLQWRKALEAAIASGELATFDVLTGFPSAPAESATATRPNSTPAQHSQAQPNPAAAAPVTHKLETRASPLAAVLTLAKRQALDPADWTSVWAALVALALPATRPAPLLGYVETEGVQYRADDAAQPAAYLTRDAFRKRFKRKG